jgi:hypothetical protein
MLTKLHASILNIHGLVGEKEATSWLRETQKASSNAPQGSKTPAKKPTAAPPPKRKTATAAAAAANGDESIVTEEVPAGAGEKDLLKEVLKPQYEHLLEMDALVREKLFILQVNELEQKFKQL